MTADNKRIAIITLIVLGTIVVALSIPFAIINIFPYFAPFIIAYLIALILEPLNKLLIKYGKMKRIYAISITFVLFVGLLSLITYFIITKITTEMLGLIKFIEKNIPNIQSWAINLNNNIANFLSLFPKEVQIQFNNIFNDFINKLTSMNLISTIGTSTVTLTAAIPNYFILSILVFVSLYLISLTLPNIHEKFYSFFKESSQQKLDIIFKELRLATVGFLQAQLILSTVTYIISLSALLILGVKYSYAIALFIVLVDMLPILGTGSTLIPWAIFSITRGNYFLGIGLIILFLVIVIVRKAIEPKVLGGRIGLSPLMTLISIWVGFRVLGIAGVFIGPLLIILYNALVKAGVIKFNIKI